LFELHNPFGVAFDKFVALPRHKFGKLPEPEMEAIVGTGITVIAKGAEDAVHPLVPVTDTE
jgi:hypothetical protein